MMARVFAVAGSTYREAVRVRLLHALSALGFAGTLYAIAIAAVSPHEGPRAIADIGAASISLCTAILATALGASALHREIAHGTIAPLLTRALRRHEYFAAKYLGTLLVLTVFVVLQGAVVLSVLALSHAARTELALVVASCTLTLSEGAVVAATSSFFSSFSSPYPAAAFTFGLFVLGRNADALSHVPARLVGPLLHQVFRLLGVVVPNLQIYVPPRALLLGEVPGSPLWAYVAHAAVNAALYAAALVTAGALLFQRRDLP